MLGGGLWGTVLANHVARHGHAVWLWEYFPELARRLEDSRKHPHIPHLELAPHVRVTSDSGAAVRGAELVVVALPSAFVRSTAKGLKALLAAESVKPWVVSASKGVEPGTLKTMGQVLDEELPFLAGRVFTLSGPSFAREVARGVHTKVMLAGPVGGGNARRLAMFFDGGPLRVQLSTDRTGVELGGSLKNVLAIGCGILDGMREAGANTRAALLTQAVDEMVRVVKARGGKAETVYGLAGLGDLILTGTSSESRNRTLGEKLGAGLKLKEALREIPTVTEGVESARSAYELVRASKLKAPLLEAIWRVLHRGASSEQLLRALGFN